MQTRRVEEAAAKAAEAILEAEGSRQQMEQAAADAAWQELERAQ